MPRSEAMLCRLFDGIALSRSMECIELTSLEYERTVSAVLMEPCAIANVVSWREERAGRCTVGKERESGACELNELAGDPERLLPDVSGPRYRRKYEHWLLPHSRIVVYVLSIRLAGSRRGGNRRSVLGGAGGEHFTAKPEYDGLT